MATAEPHPMRDSAEKTVHQRWERLGFPALLPTEQQYIAIWWLVAEVMNGGMHQYFSNSSGDLAPLAAEGLKAIGATESLTILERAIAIFSPGGYSTDRATRLQRLSAISDDVDEEIAAFDEVSDALGDYPEDIKGLSLDRLAALYSSNGLMPDPIQG